jgi:ribosomal protein S18 acetylase RimI-like enzyme
MEIRAVRLEDAAAVARVQVASWREAYRQLFPDEVLAGLSEAARAERWTRILSEAAPRHQMWVLDEGAGIVGFASTGPNRNEELLAEGAGELWAIYLHPDTFGRRLGVPLLERAVQGMRDDGFSFATLWVLEGNARARRFYEREGWEHDGAIKSEAHEGVTLPSVRYRRWL